MERLVGRGLDGKRIDKPTRSEDVIAYLLLLCSCHVEVSSLKGKELRQSMACAIPMLVSYMVHLASTGGLRQSYLYTT